MGIRNASTLPLARSQHYVAIATHEEDRRQRVKESNARNCSCEEGRNRTWGQRTDDGDDEKEYGQTRRHQRADSLKRL